MGVVLFKLSAWTYLVSCTCCMHARVCTASPLLIHLFILRLSFVLHLLRVPCPASHVLPHLLCILCLLHVPRIAGSHSSTHN